MSVIITIDGPAASGKSSTARAVADRLGFSFLDTGALYRSITLAAMRAGVAPEEGPDMDAFLAEMDLAYSHEDGWARVLLGGEDISEEIRGAEVTAQVSPYSALASVRGRMLSLQRSFAEAGDVVAEGRDMGSVVFPGAELKIYLKSDPEERAKRRVRDYEAQGRTVDLDAVLEEIRRRDTYDSERENSPLIVPEGAVLLDNSNLSLEEQVEEVLRLAGEHACVAAGGRPDTDTDQNPVRKSDGDPDGNQDRNPDELLYTDAELETRTRPRMRPAYRFCWVSLRGIFRFLHGIRYIDEEKSAVVGPLLLASNHIAYIDPPVVGSGVRRELSFVAKKELFVPVLGRLIRYLGAIPINRGAFDRQALKEVRQRLAEGGAVIIFPEGTRKPPGRLGRAKSGLGMLAAETDAPVLPVFIKGTRRLGSALLRRSAVELRVGRILHIAPLRERGLEGRELYRVFGEYVMAEIARLERVSEAEGRGASSRAE